MKTAMITVLFVTATSCAMSDEEFCDDAAASFCDQTADCFRAQGVSVTSQDERDCIDNYKTAAGCTNGAYCPADRKFDAETAEKCLQQIEETTCDDIAALLQTGDISSVMACHDVCQLDD